MAAPDSRFDSSAGAVSSSLWRLWAKWSKQGGDAPADGETFHPLICHLLDVASVARALWQSGLPAPTRARLTRHLELPDEDSAGAWISFFAGLHDLGKASPGFQDQLRDGPAGATIREWMHQSDLNFTNSQWVAHGTVSAFVLGYYLKRLGVGATVADQIATLVGGHHGIFPRAGDLNALNGQYQVGGDRWDDMREQLVAALRTGLLVPELAPQGALTPADALVFAGFVSVADWIGSDENHFHHAGRLAAAPHPLPLDEYAALAESHAREALAPVRMDPFAGGATRERRTFATVFPHIKKPNDAQLRVIELADQLREPALVILEAPMGEGKTEAALFLAEAWNDTQARQGLYIALPTQATSNQMYGRVGKYLLGRFAGGDYVAAHLVYGESLFHDEFQSALDRGRAHAAALADAQDSPTNVADKYDSDTDEQSSHESLPLEHEGPVYEGPGQEGGAEGTVVAMEWFAAPKRALLAPFGVGTIDQALLGVLQTKHFFVRMFGLAGKTVIVDEVHAYDTYMSTLLKRLLEWLGAFGTPVVLLSATLPSAKRAELLAAYASGAGFSPAEDIATPPYPRLTWRGAGTSGACEVRASAAVSRVVALEWLNTCSPDAPEGLAALGAQLKEALHDGGCAAVICNTVKRAQEVYTALKPLFTRIEADGAPELDLFHARFLRAQRVVREERALRRFGKPEGGDLPDGQRNPNRPTRAVLVATQVIEQSLDLDFDLMVSDLAPVDLLLQRSGRLHRHRANDDYRPRAVATPRLLIPRPEERDDCPQFPRSDEYVYDAHFLLRAWLALHQRAEIHLPAEIEPLIERAYELTATCPDGVSAGVHEVWERTLSKYQHAMARDRDKAHLRVVAPPDSEAVYTGLNLGLRDVEEAPDADQTALALTRLGTPSVRVVLLPEARARQQFKAKGRPPNRKATRNLLSQATTLSHMGIVPTLIQQAPPTHWKKSPWLRHTRLLALDRNDQCVIQTRDKKGKLNTFVLKLDQELGVVIERQSPEDA